MPAPFRAKEVVPVTEEIRGSAEEFSRRELLEKAGKLTLGGM